MSKHVERSRYDLSEGIKGRPALITGGSSGIGEACADALHACGANVAITYATGKDRAQAIQARLGGEDMTSIHRLDLMDESSPARLFDEMQQRWPDWLKRGILVHSAAAGSATIGKYADAASQLAAFYKINLISAHILLEEAIKRMDQLPDQQRRDIIAISSVGSYAAVFPQFNIADGVSKAALVYLMKNLAVQHTLDARFRINAICPGATQTPMLQASFLSYLDSLGPEARADFESNHAAGGRLIQPKEIADNVVFLCSNLASAIRGAVIDASAGLAIHPGLITEWNPKK